MRRGTGNHYDSHAGADTASSFSDVPVREWRLIQILCDTIPLNEADRADLELTWRIRFGGLDACELGEQELTRLAATSTRIMCIAEDHYRGLGLRVSR